MENEYVVSPYIWLMFDYPDKSIMKEIETVYIPYNCRFLLVENDFSISEIYNPRIGEDSYRISAGKWTKINGFENFELDIYKTKRISLNGIIITSIGIKSKKLVSLRLFFFFFLMISEFGCYCYCYCIS